MRSGDQRVDPSEQAALISRSRSNSSSESSIYSQIRLDSPELDEADLYDKAIVATGFGRFHYLFLLVCGWANASDAIEILCISFLLPAAECDLQLTSVDKGWLSASVFLGMLIGGYIWGSLSDSFGRRNVLITSLFVNATCVFLSSLSQNKYTFIVMRFLSGLGVGGSIPVVWTYFGEFQPKSKRGGMLSFLATFWMIGNITVAAIAWAIIPRDIGYDTTDPNEFEYNSWRIFVLVCGIPPLLVAISLFWCPESPKYLLAKGKEQQALKVLRNMFAFNTRKPKSDYPIDRLIYGSIDENQFNTSKSIKETFEEAWTNTKFLFSGTLARVTILMLFINFAIQYGYYGLWLWFPELFNKLDQYYANHTETKTVCQVTNLNTADDDGGFCDQDPPSSDVYINSFIISISALPGNIWTILQMDKLGRKFFLVLSMTLSGLCAFSIYLVSSELANLLVSCLFGLVSTMGFNSLDCLGIELFPTDVRSTAMAMTLVPARLGAILGNITFGYLVETNCAVPILMVAALLISGGLAGLALPNTTKVPLE